MKLSSREPAFTSLENASMELSHAPRVESFRALPFAGRRKCRKLAGFAGRCLLRSSLPRLWRHHLQIRPAPRVAVEDMVAAAAVFMEVAAVFTAAASMAAAVVSTAAASMAVVVSTVVAEASTAEASVSEDFTAGDFTAALFVAADFMAAPHMPFAPLRGQDAATVRVAFKPTLKSDLPALAQRMFLEVPSLDATPSQVERLRATPAR